MVYDDVSCALLASVPLFSGGTGAGLRGNYSPISVLKQQDACLHWVIKDDLPFIKVYYQIPMIGYKYWGLPNDPIALW